MRTVRAYVEWSRPLADGVEAEDVLRSVEAELLGLLSLQDCRFEQPPFVSSIPRMERNGTIEGGRRRFIGGQFTLPGEGVEIPVFVRVTTSGVSCWCPTGTSALLLEERVVAIALVDLVGAAFAAEPTRVRQVRRDRHRDLIGPLRPEARERDGGLQMSSTLDTRGGRAGPSEHDARRGHRRR